MRPWRVQLVSTATGTEMARAVVKEAARSAGFSCDVWDIPGFSMNPALNTSAASVRAVYDHDIIIALVDSEPGSRFALDDAPADMVTDLRAMGVLPPSARGDLVPSIFQAEVLTAKALDRPTLVLIPEDVRSTVDRTIRLLRDATPPMLVRGQAHQVRPIEDYVERADWYGLYSAYDVPALLGIPFDQVVFVKRLMTEGPNWCTVYRRSEPDELGLIVQAGLRAIPLALTELQPRKVRERMSRQRDPLGTESVTDHFSSGRILDPPYRLESGEPIGASCLLPARPGGAAGGRIDRGGLVDLLRRGRNVLLLGESGLGKSTCLLLAAHSASTSQGVSSDIVLYGTWRELSDIPPTAGAVIRKLIGTAAGRDPWPEAIALPDATFRLVLDGLDESPWPFDTLRDLLVELGDSGSLLVSCRASDFERKLRGCVSAFDTVIRMLPWGPAELAEYVTALRRIDQHKAANYIEDVGIQRNGTREPSLLSFPLWLSMVSYLAERFAERSADLPAKELSAVVGSDYSLLLACGQAIASEECYRHGLRLAGHGRRLEEIWAQMAWILHSSLRPNSPLPRAPEVLRRVGLAEDDPFARPARSVLLEYEDRVVGFVHQVLLEFWLAQRILGDLTGPEINPVSLSRLLSVQRSLLTNRLIRHGVRRSGQADRAAAALRAGYSKIDSSNVFAKNQLLYLLGRIDTSSLTRQFLADRWRDRAEPEFVRYSAAYAGVIAGDDAVEREFYETLATGGTLDRINRGYLRYYYGDLSAREEDLPVLDDGGGSASSAMHQLVDRLGRRGDHHRRLRRIELLTLRRFLETRPCPPSVVDALHATLDGLAARQPEGVADAEGAARELDSLIARLGGGPLPSSA